MKRKGHSVKKKTSEKKWSRRDEYNAQYSNAKCKSGTKDCDNGQTFECIQYIVKYHNTIQHRKIPVTVQEHCNYIGHCFSYKKLRFI